MSNRLIQIGRFGNLLLFVFLEIIAFYLIISFNNKQRTIFLHSSSFYAASINNRITKVNNYFSLSEKNQQLEESNSDLQNQLSNALQYIRSQDSTLIHSDFSGYEYTMAEIISYTTSLRNNSMVINKGKKEGLDEGMAVLDRQGIVGITKRCTENFCSVLPVIHSNVNISAKVASCDCYGRLSWEGGNPNILNLYAIPKHVEINEGDSVLTSGFSLIFPPEIYVGKVISASVPSGSNFYDIQVEIVNDLYRLHYVYVVKNLMREEFDLLLKDEDYEN